MYLVEYHRAILHHQCELSETSSYEPRELENAVPGYRKTPWLQIIHGTTVECFAIRFSSIRCRCSLVSNG